MLYFFTKSEKGAGGTRHRAIFVSEFLKKRGYDSIIVTPPVYRKDIPRNKARMEYLSTIFSLRKNDAVFLQNPIFSTYFIVCICIVKIIFRPTLIFDFDDSTWIQNPIAPRVMALISDKYILASHFLTSWKPLGIRPLSAKPTMVMANLVDYTIADKYKVENKGDKVVIGWIGGGPNSMVNLIILKPILETLIKDGVSFKFLFVGTLGSEEVVKFFSLPGLDVEFVDRLDWGKEGEIQKANSMFDVGLCPLLDNVSNRGRCSLKILDYMASGVPVVASPVGENIYFIENNVTGLLPNTTEEWVRDLKRIISDKELRESMGRASYLKLKTEYSYQANIDKYIDFLNLKP